MVIINIIINLEAHRLNSGSHSRPSIGSDFGANITSQYRPAIIIQASIDHRSNIDSQHWLPTLQAWADHRPDHIFLHGIMEFLTDREWKMALPPNIRGKRVLKIHIRHRHINKYQSILIKMTLSSGCRCCPKTIFFRNCRNRPNMVRDRYSAFGHFLFSNFSKLQLAGIKKNKNNGLKEW